MNKEKLQEVFSDEAFVKSLFELDTAAEVQAALPEVYEGKTVMTVGSDLKSAAQDDPCLKYRIEKGKNYWHYEE